MQRSILGAATVVTLLVFSPAVYAQPALCEDSYSADSGTFPDESMPPWASFVSGAPTIELDNGILRITTVSDGENVGYTHAAPVIGTPDVLIVEARMRLVSGTSSSPSRAPAQIVITTADNLQKASLHWEETGIFMESAPSVRGPSAAIQTMDALHTYRLEIDTTTGEADVFQDDVLVLQGNTFPEPTPQPLRIFWGEGSILAHGISEWEFVKHNASTVAGECGGACSNPPNIAMNWKISRCVVPQNQLPFQINALGTRLPDETLVMTTRDGVSGLSDHNVISVLPDGTDVTSSTTQQYPNAGSVEQGRFGAGMTPDPNDPASAVLIADAGTFCVGSGGGCSGTFGQFQNGRIFRANLLDGSMTTVVDRGELIDPLSIAQDNGGNVYVADRGKFDAGEDGRVATLNGSVLTTTVSGIDAQDVAFLPDGSYLVSTSNDATIPGVYHVVDDVVASQLTTRHGTLSLPNELPDCGVRFYLNAGDTIYEIIDNTNDFVADIERPIVENTSNRSGLETAANGSLYFVATGPASNDAVLTITETPGAADPQVCGDPVEPGANSRRHVATAVTASDSLHVLRAAVGNACCDLCVCDVNDSTAITATDALTVLQKAVGIPIELTCPQCGD